MSKGFIGIHGLQVSCIVGCNKHERIHHQTLLIDVKFEYDFTHCEGSDHLYSTIDYETVADLITQTAHEGKFHLIEAFAATCAKNIVKKYPKIKECYIKVVKHAAIERAESCYVEYTYANKAKKVIQSKTRRSKKIS